MCCHRSMVWLLTDKAPVSWVIATLASVPVNSTSTSYIRISDPLAPVLPTEELPISDELRLELSAE